MKNNHLRPKITVAPSERSFNYASYCYVIGALFPALTGRAGDIEIDLSKQRFFFPDGMAPLCAVIRHLAERDILCNVVLPDNDQLVAYFRSAGWYAAIVNDPPPARRLGSTYLPLSFYDTYSQLNVLVSEAVRVVSEADVVSSGVLDAIEWTLNEIADNVVNHAGAKVRGWMQLSVYPKRGEVEMVVVDNGRGIRASLAEGYPDLSDDVSAIELALKKGITRDKKVGQGNGLSGSVRITSAANGHLNIHSGTGLLRMHEGRVQCRDVTFHPGTVVSITVPTTGDIDPTTALWGIPPMPAFEVDYTTGQGISFKLAEEAPGFGNRATGRALRNKLINIMQQFPDQQVLIDFTGVDLVAASFTDEFLAKLAVSMGVVRFFGRVRLQGMSQFVQVTLDNVLKQRLATADELGLVAGGAGDVPSMVEDEDDGPPEWAPQRTV